MAIAVMFAALFPDRTLLLQFFIPVPAAVAVGGYILLDVLGLVGGGSLGGNVAHAAHLAGAAYGLAWWWFRVR
jgi:membrane associated rhomboid family serine protease